MQGKLKFKLTTQRHVDSHTVVTTETLTKVKIETYSTSMLAREMFKQMAYRFLIPPEKVNNLRYRGQTVSDGHETLVECDVIVGSNKIRRNILALISAFTDRWKVGGKPVDSFLDNAKPIR